MNPSPRRLPALAAVALALLPFLPAVRAQDAPATAPADDALQREVQALVRQLADDSYDVREQATRRLWQIGPPAEAALRQAARSSDAEVVERAEGLLEKIRYGITPDTSEQVAALLRQYIDADSGQRLNIVQRLIEEGRDGCVRALTLARGETDKALREQILQRVAARVKEVAPALLAEDRTQEAVDLFEQVLAAGDDTGIRAYGAYLLTAGGLEDKIRALEPKKDQPAAARALAHMYLARGDMAKAAAAAETAADAGLRIEIALKQGDWKTLARLYQAEHGEATDEVKLGLLAAFHGLAGNAKQSEQAIAALLKEPQGDERSGRDPQNACGRGKALMLNDRVDEAIQLRRKAGDHDWVLDVLVAQHRYAEALQVQEASLRGRAELLWSLGRKDQAGKLLAEILAEAERSDNPAERYYDATRLEWQWGRKDEAIRHAARYLEKREPWPNLREVSYLFFRGQSRLADLRWRLQRRVRPDEPLAKALESVREWMAVPADRQRVLELARLAEKASAESDSETRGGWLLAIRGALGEAGCKEEADYAKKFAELGLSDSWAWADAGRGMAKQGRWEEAVECFANAWQAKKGDAAYLFDYGWALSKVGRDQEGRKQMTLARVLPLADADARSRLGDRMDAWGLADRQASEEQILLRVGAWTDYGYGEALSGESRRAAAAGDHRRAADCLLLSRLQVLPGGMEYTDVEGYLASGVRVREARIRGYVAAKQYDEAIAEYDAAWRLIPADTDATILTVGLLDKAGQKDKADAVFARAAAFHQKLVADYPDSGYLLNGLAWLAVRCRRRLDDALAWANRAVELEPQRHQYIDTLAEVHFQRGQTPRAIELMQQCIKLAPDWKYYANQLKRFQAADPSTDPPE